MEEVLLKEFIPIEDVTSGTGIDGNQESTRYYNWDDLMPNQWTKTPLSQNKKKVSYSPFDYYSLKSTTFIFIIN